MENRCLTEGRVRKWWLDRGDMTGVGMPPSVENKNSRFEQNFTKHLKWRHDRKAVSKHLEWDTYLERRRQKPSLGRVRNGQAGELWKEGPGMNNDCLSFSGPTSFWRQALYSSSHRHTADPPARGQQAKTQAKTCLSACSLSHVGQHCLILFLPSKTF